MWQGRSAIFGLRGRLLAVIMAMMLIASVASVALMSRLLAVRSRDSLDRYLDRQARDFIGATAPVTAATALPVFAAAFFEKAGHDPRELVFLVQARDGRVVSTVPALELDRLPEVQALIAAGSGEGWTRTRQGSVRLAARPVLIAGAPAGVVLVARFTDPLERTRAEMLRLMFLVLLGTLAVAGGAGYLLAGKALEPLRRITRTARLISREDLSRRIDFRGPHDEVGELAATFNEMLGRLETAFAEQQQFLSDISHELRTPMQVIRGHLEVLRRLPAPSPQEYHETLALVLDEIDRMARLVGQLLTLARSSGALAEKPLAVRPFLDEILRKAESLAPRRFALEVGEDLTVLADRDALTQIMLNLVQNAVDNTSPGDRITIGAEGNGYEVRLWVRDTGRGIPAEALPHVFERFYRVGENGSTGLGLAIVDALVRAHGGRVQVQSQAGQGATFEVILLRR